MFGIGSMLEQVNLKTFSFRCSCRLARRLMLIETPGLQALGNFGQCGQCCLWGCSFWVNKTSGKSYEQEGELYKDAM